MHLADTLVLFFFHMRLLHLVKDYTDLAYLLTKSIES